MHEAVLMERATCLRLLAYRTQQRVGTNNWMEAYLP